MSYNVDVSENQGVIRLLTLNHKVLRGLLLFGTVVGMGLTSATLPAQASNHYLKLPYQGYVRTRKTMYVGISQKHGKKYKPLLVKKGTVLQLYSQSENGHKVKASFTLGAVHYDKIRNLRYAQKPTIPLTKSNFKRVNLKAPIRATVLRQGTGFKLRKHGYSSAPLFYLTLDNYIQYYNISTVNRYDPCSQDMYVLDGLQEDVYKPSASAKMIKTTVKGNTTTVKYRPAIKGLPGKKIGRNTYQLKIKDLKKHVVFDDGTGSDEPIWDGGWDCYTVNGNPYYAGRMATTDI